jgi:hypothetical protein
MPHAEQYPFVEMDPALGAASRLPYLPVALTVQQRTVPVMGLLDTGSTINVLPYDIGVQLGAVWEEQTTPVQLTGNLAQAEARVLVVTAAVGKFPPVRLAFAWTKVNTVPVILGQVNFFLEFDVCCFRARSVFEIKPK